MFRIIIVTLILSVITVWCADDKGRVQDEGISETEEQSI